MPRLVVSGHTSHGCERPSAAWWCQACGPVASSFQETTTRSPAVLAFAEIVPTSVLSATLYDAAPGTLPSGVTVQPASAKVLPTSCSVPLTSDPAYCRVPSYVLAVFADELNVEGPGGVGSAVGQSIE